MRPILLPVSQSGRARDTRAPAAELKLSAVRPRAPDGGARGRDSCLCQDVKERSAGKRRRKVENNGFEPLTPCLQSRCSSQLS